MQTRIKEYRIALGLTQAELADKANVARTIIVQLEQGTRSVIKSDTMVKLAKALGKSIDDIFLT